MASRVGNITDLINSLTGLAPVFAGSGKTTQTSQSLDDSSRAALQKLLQGNQFSKDAAIKDSNLAVDSVVRKILEGGAPQIANARKGTGLFNDTTSQLLNNDLITRAAEQGAVVQLQTIKDFAQIKNQAAQNLKGSKVTKTSETGPIIEDPVSAALKTAGIGLGVSLGSKALGGILGSIFGDDKKKRKDDEDLNFGSGFGDSGSAIDFSPSFSSDIEFGNANRHPQDLSDFQLPDLGSEIRGGGASGDNAGGFDLTNVLGGVVNAVAHPVIEALGGTLNSDGQGGFTGGFNCFITTAVCEASGYPDDCYELETLREFRDTYMTETPERKAKVQQYYAEAPQIVDYIATLPEERRSGIYTDFLHSYIEPAIHAIETDDLDEAFEIYVNLFYVAKALTEE